VVRNQRPSCFIFCRRTNVFFEKETVWPSAKTTANHDGIREWVQPRGHPAVSADDSRGSDSRFSKFVSKESADR